MCPTETPELIKYIFSKKNGNLEETASVLFDAGMLDFFKSTMSTDMENKVDEISTVKN